MSNFRYWGDMLIYRPRPARLQTISNYAGTLLFENGMRTRREMAWLTGGTTALGSLLQDFPLADEAANRLSKLTDTPSTTLQGASFNYLLKKFGWSIRPNSVHIVLANGLCSVKCFCPACLRERPYFILPWRFSVLPGCHLHHCELVDRCPHCNQILSLNEVYCGTLCPKCAGDLSTSESKPLSPSQDQVAANTFSDLEYLLTVQGYEDSASFPEHIGQELASIRKNQTKSQVQIRESLNFPSTGIKSIETHGGGRPFMRYWAYCNFLKVNFRDLFKLAQNNKRLKRERWTAGELLAEVNRVYPHLAASNERVTQQQIADEIGVTITTLKGHKKVLGRLAEIAALNFWTEDELLAEVNRVYSLLAASNERVTQQQIADEIGVPYSTMLPYKMVKRRLAEIAALYMWTDDELLSEVNRVYQVLAASTERVTGQQIADGIGVTVNTLRGHKKVLERLAEIAALNFWTEDELLAEVNRVYQVLAASNERVAQQQIADEIGVPRSTLTSHSMVKHRLAEITALYMWTEDELLAEVNRVYQVLAASNERVTQQQIASEIGVSVQAMRRHKKVRERLAEISAWYR